MTPCDAHFENGEAVCSCTEAERFNSAPRDDECEWCKATLATKTLSLIPNGTMEVCDECYEAAMNEPLDPNAKYKAGS